MTFPGILDQLIVPFFLLFILIGSLGGLVLGAGLLWRTAATLRFIQGMNRWVSTRRATRELEVPREGLRRSRWLGAFLVAGAAFSCYFLLVRLQIPRAALSAADPRFAMALVIDATRWVLIVGCVIAFAMGVLVLFAPATLARLETR